MGCITKKLRGYGLGAMMLQLPIVAVQKSKYFRGKTILNVCFFFFFFFFFFFSFSVNQLYLDQIVWFANAWWLFYRIPSFGFR